MEKIIFEDDMSSSVHIENKGGNIIIFGEEPMQGLHDTILIFVLSLNYNGSNSFLFGNAPKVYQFKTKDSEIKHYKLCLHNVSNNFVIYNMKKQG